MKTHLLSLSATILATALAGPAPAYDQLARNAGLTEAEAAGLSLSAIAEAKFNRDNSDDDQAARVAAPASASGRAGLARYAGITAEEAAGMSLNEIAAVKFSRDSGDNELEQPRTVGVALSTRSVDRGRWPALISNARLTTEEAASLSLTEVAAVKFARDSDDQ